MMKKLFLLGICLVLAITSVAVACQQEKTYPEVIVSVKLVADEEYRQRDSWQEEAGELLRETSDFFQKEFGISFLAEEFIEWDSPDLSPVPDGEYELAGTQWLADNAADDIPSQGKLVVIFSKEDLSRRYHGVQFTTERRGLKEYYVLIWTDSLNPRNSLIHEIGHVFGAKHPQDWSWEYAEKYPSVMDPVKVDSTSMFDPKNRQIILDNRNKFQEEVQNQVRN